MSQSSKESKNKWLEANKHKRPEINKNSRLRTFYGITPERYNEMIIEQDNKCAICEIEFGNEKHNKPHLDHNHSSGWVRQLLCSTCNTGIGMFEDDIGRMQRAIDYLIENATPTEFNIIMARDACKFKTRWDNPERREEYQRDARERMTGNKFREGIPAWNKGTPWSEETKQKMRKPHVFRKDG